MRVVILVMVSVLTVSVAGTAAAESLCGRDLQDRAGTTGGRLAGLPAEFDWRDRDGYFWMTPIRDQSGCGLDFVYGVVGALEANIKIQANNPWAMPDFCEEDSIPEWRIADVGWTHWQIDSIKAAILKGPVVGRLVVCDDFFAYQDGVYEHEWGDVAGEHYVVLLGWSDADSCWICKNSWGIDWGQDGWFRIRYGQCEIEDNGAYWLVPISWGRDGALIPRTSYQYELGPEATMLDTLVMINTFSCDSMSFAFEITSHPVWIVPATFGDTLHGGDTLWVEFEVNSAGLEGSSVDTMMVEICDSQGEQPELRPIRMALDVYPTYRQTSAEGPVLPGEHVLWQNYPNPFNARTTIRYQIFSPTRVTLKIYNLLGQEVNTLVDEDQTAGMYLLDWNAQGFSSGIFVCTMRAGAFQETRRMVLLK